MTKQEAAISLILTSITTKDKEINSKCNEFEKLPFVTRVLLKKIDFAEIKTKITELASLLLGVYAEGNPGMVQILFAKCLEKNNKIVNVNLIVELWPCEIPSPESTDWEKEWDGQKIRSNNAVDYKEFWQLIESGKTIKEAVQILNEKTLL